MRQLYNYVNSRHTGLIMDFSINMGDKSDLSVLQDMEDKWQLCREVSRDFDTLTAMQWLA